MSGGVLSTGLALSPIMLGQLSGLADRDVTLAWILGLAGAAVMFNQAAQAWKTLTGKFSQGATPEGGYRTRHDCIEIHKALNAHRERVAQALADADTELRREIKADIKDLNGRIDLLISNISNLTAAVLDRNP